MMVRAVVVDAPGGPQALRLGEREVRGPGPGEIRVRVGAATVNPADVVVRSLGPDFGRPGQVPPPWTPGMEGAGVVESVGDQVPDLYPGMRVAFFADPSRPDGGAQAQLVVVPAASAAVLPDDLDDVHAATLPMNGLTARAALDLLGLRPGQLLGVTGSAGAVGGYVIELGRAAGLRVVAEARAEDEALVRRLGAHEVALRGPDVTRGFRALVPAGVDGLVDAAVLDGAVLGAIRDGGALVTLRGWGGPARPVRGIRVSPVHVNVHGRDTQKLAELVHLATQGRLTPRVARELPAGEAATAHQVLEAGRLEGARLRGRLVLRLPA